MLPFTERVGRRAGEIGLLVDLHGPHARRIDRQQQVAVRLQMERAGIGRTGEEIDGLRVLRIAHVDDGDAVAEAVADIGVAAMHHDLHAVAAAALVAVADELDVAGRHGIHRQNSFKRMSRSRFDQGRQTSAAVQLSRPARNPGLPGFASWCASLAGPTWVVRHSGGDGAQARQLRSRWQIGSGASPCICGPSTPRRSRPRSMRRARPATTRSSCAAPISSAASMPA